jgi:hypothetical protein
MTLRAKILTAGLLVATLPTMAVAQIVNERVQAQPVPGQPGQVQPGAAAATVAADNQQQIQQLTAHALSMAICGSELQFAAQSARGGRHQDQNADNDRNRRDRDDNADNDQNRRDRDDNADNDQNRRNRDRDNDDNNANNQARRQAHRQAVQQLRQQASHQFESSNQLFQAAENDLRASEANEGNRAGDRSAWSRRLYTVAHQYANTLRDLSGASNRPSGSVGGQTDQERGNNDNQNRNRSDRNPNRTEIAQITLINHAVSEARGAFELTQWNNATRSAAQSASGQQLQAHARQMASESQQLLQNVIASANWQNNDAQGRQQGQASVQSLAQQARQVIDTLQRISGSRQGAGAVAPGAEQ